MGADLRFLREFDKSDRDPSSTSARLRNFAHELRTLFVDGWIMVAPGPAASRGQAPPKTLTQIGMEQIEEMTEVTYDGKVKTLWTRRVSRRECAESLQAVQSVVQDTLDRRSV